jgi:hypothetical protein
MTEAMVRSLTIGVPIQSVVRCEQPVSLLDVFRFSSSQVPLPECRLWPHLTVVTPDRNGKVKSRLLQVGPHADIAAATVP